MCYVKNKNHFNVSLIVRDKVTRQRPQTATSEEKGEPKRIRTEVPLLTSITNALPLGQTGSQEGGWRVISLTGHPVFSRCQMCTRTARRVFKPRSFKKPTEPILRTIRDGEPKTATSTSTQLPSSDSNHRPVLTDLWFKTEVVLRPRSVRSVNSGTARPI